MIINKYLAKYHFSEHHKINVNGTNVQIMNAIMTLRKNEISRIMNFLMSVRLIAVKDKKRVINQNKGILLDEMQSNKFIILERSEKELVLGLIGKFWNLSDPMELEINSPAEFLNFDDGEYGVVAFNFLVKEMEGKNVLTTETRIKITDPKSRRKFAIYWFFIYLGSSYIRYLLLKAIKRKVENR